VTTTADGDRLVRLFGEASRHPPAPPTPPALRRPGEPRVRIGPDLEVLDLVVELFGPGPEAAVQLVRAGADHPTAIPHDGEAWAQVAVLSLAAPWIHRALHAAEEAGLVVQDAMSTPGGNYVSLVRPITLI
jgi:hypothetical protein